MIYEWSIEVPPATYVDDPAELDITLVEGTITRISIQSAPQAAGQLYCRLIHGIHQIYPSDSRFWFRLDGTPIVHDDERQIASDFIYCKLQAVNLDPTFDHSFRFRMTLIPKRQRPFIEERVGEAELLLDWLGGI